MVGGSDLNGRSTASRAGSTVGSVGSHIASSLTSSTSAGSSGRGTRPSVRKAAGRGRGTSDASGASKGSSSASGGLTSTTHEKTPKATPVKVPGASPAATSEQSPAVFRSGEEELDWSVFFMRLAQHRNTCISEFNEKFSYLVPLLRYLVQCSGEGANLNRPSMTITRKEYDAFVRFFPVHSMMEDIAWMNEKRFFMLGAHTQGVEAELKKKRKPRVSYYQSAEDSDNPVSEDVQYTKGDFLLRPSRTQKGKIAVTYLIEDFTPRHILIDDLNPHSDFSFSFNGYRPPRGTLGDPSLSAGKGSLRQYVDLLSSDASQPFFKRGCGTCVPPSQAQTSPLRPLFRDDPGTASSADVSGQCNVGINSMSTDTWDGFIQTEGYSGTRENSDATNPLSFSGVSDMCDKDFSYITPTKVCLGRGSFGEVFKAVDTRTNECLALKRMSRAGGPSQWEKIRREITIMARLEHPNIVKYHGSATKAEMGCLEIYMELMSESLLETTKRLHIGTERGSADDVMDALTRYGRQVVSGLKYLHDNNVVHRVCRVAHSSHVCSINYPPPHRTSNPRTFSCLRTEW